jgi:heparanase 1
MNRYRTASRMVAAAALVVTAAVAATAASKRGAPLGDQAVPTINLAALPAVGRVDERFQAYNVESVEVAGGNFWAPYPKPGEGPRKGAVGPHGVEFATGDYQNREPIDLTNRRLRVLTKALGPSYMRVSGSWANSIYFQDDDDPPKAPPEGYQGVMTRRQWAGAVDFAKAVDARILTSFAVSPGAKRADGSWNPEGARRLFAYTRSIGGRIDAVELMNEPNVARPAYSADLYARDTAELRKLIDEVSPGTKLVGPGATGEAGFKLFTVPPAEASTARLLGGSPPPRFDVFSHHFYGAVSERCKSMSARRGTDVTTSRAEALTEGWLSRADQAQRYYKGVRDKFAPGAPMWITETAQTACGGDRWAATFLDTFRYVDQLGRLAKQGVSISFHNTLAASDYALIDERTWLPRPNYWAALLWRRTMGEVVLDAGANQGDLHIYAHCLREGRGGVGLVAVNLSRTSQGTLRLPVDGQQYVLSADTLEGTTVKLNGRVLALGKSDELPALPGRRVKAGTVSIAPTTIGFFALPGAGNQTCR